VVTIGRAALVALAVVACAWFVLGARQAHEINAATAAVTGSGRLSAAAAQRVRSQLSAAKTLDPDRTPEILLGQLAVRQRDYGAALRALEPVTRSEPMNLEAWVQLVYAAALVHDRAVLVSATRHVSALFPKLR
jgi:hypothetical protein